LKDLATEHACGEHAVQEGISLVEQLREEVEPHNARLSCSSKARGCGLRGGRRLRPLEQQAGHDHARLAKAHI
jgi:hypothetical protein